MVLILMHISVKQIYRVLAATGISSSLGEHILTEVKKLSISPKVKEKSAVNETHVSHEEKSVELEIEGDAEKM